MKPNDTILHLLATAEGRATPLDSVWMHLEDESYLVAPANMPSPNNTAELVIDVVGILPLGVEGWSLLLG